MQEKFINHLNTHCDRLEPMHRMFASGRDKQIVLEAFTSLHGPANYSQERNSQKDEA